MKKILFLICLCLTAVAASADVTSSTGRRYTNFAGVDYMFMFNGITTSSTVIEYTGTGTDVKWYKFTDTNHTTPVTTQTSFSPDGDTGYTLVVDGKETTIWVIDYSKYLPTLTSIKAQDNADKCNYVDLLINANVPPLTYKTPGGATKTIPRDFQITYSTLKWSDTAWAKNDTTITISSSVLTTLVPIKVPYHATTFTLSGDQFAEDLNMTKASVSSDLYTPSAVICHETSVVVTRDATNEAERPTAAKQVTGSAPLDMTFYSNPNGPIALYNNWQIFKDKSKTSLISGRIENSTPFTFDEAGSYVVKVTVSNATCSYSDSITVTVSTSSIEAPNVFTPNGDGHNDEFRVAYKSIIQFDAWVYNRWGRLVYKWSDPMKGWDGNIGGKKAAAGAYFYVIKAVGADGKKYKLKGDINLLR